MKLYTSETLYKQFLANSIFISIVYGKMMCLSKGLLFVLESKRLVSVVSSLSRKF